MTRFPCAGACANYTGTAPVQIASADSNRHRLLPYDDRQLNSAIHTAAMVQIRMPASASRVYYDKKIAEGKTPRGATRSFKRCLARDCGSNGVSGPTRRLSRRGRCRDDYDTERHDREEEA